MLILNLCRFNDIREKIEEGGIRVGAHLNLKGQDVSLILMTRHVLVKGFI